MYKRKILAIICSCLIGLCMMLGLSSCGGKECAHVWANATCTTPKTCTLCNATDGEALGHTWVDATESEPKKCSVCGITEGEALTPDDTSCTHEANIEKTIDLTSYNLCIDELHILSCKCGQAMELPYGDADEPILGGVADLMKCSWILLDEDGETDDNGNILNYHTNSICWDCGLEIYTILTQENGELQCQTVYNTKSTISIGGKDILKDVPCKVSVSSHDLAFGGDSDSVTYESIDLSEHSTCGGGYSIGTCTACGEVVPSWGSYFGALGTPFECDLDDVQASTETQTDASGVAHTVLTVSCPDCGLKFVQDSYPESEDGCEISGTRKITVYNASNAVVYSDSWAVRVSGEHSYKTERKSLGDGIGCDVYYAERRVCETCGKKEYGYKTTGHALYKTSLELDEYSACGGEFVYYACEYCDHKTIQERYHIGCEYINEYFYFVSPEERVDPDGIVHEIYSLACPDCGLTFEEDHWVEMNGSCVGEVFTKVSISKNNQKIISVIESSNTRDFHEYTVVGTLRGTSCEDGVDVIETCSKCGDLRKYTTYECKNESEVVELGCGRMRVHRCLYCGEATIDPFSYAPCMFGTLLGTDKDGYPIYSCNYCETRVCDKTIKSEKDENCGYSMTGFLIYYVGEVEVVTVRVNENSTEHDYELTSKVMNGTTCEDGYSTIYTCRNCGDSYEGKDDQGSCEYEKVTYNYGCGVSATVCCICGNVQSFRYSCDERYFDGYGEYGLETSVCGKNCGLIGYDGQIDEKIGDCMIQSTFVRCAVYDDEVVVLYTEVGTKESHDYVYTFEMNGSNCEDGFLENCECVTCGYSLEEHYHADHDLYDVYSLNCVDYDFCSHHCFFIMKCACEENSRFGYEGYRDDSEYDSDYPAEYTCEYCDYRVTYEVSGEEEIFTLYCGNEEIYTHTKSVSAVVE